MQPNKGVASECVKDGMSKNVVVHGKSYPTHSGLLSGNWKIWQNYFSGKCTSIDESVFLI